MKNKTEYDRYFCKESHYAHSVFFEEGTVYEIRADLDLGTNVKRFEKLKPGQCLNDPKTRIVSWPEDMPAPPDIEPKVDLSFSERLSIDQGENYLKENDDEI